MCGVAGILNYGNRRPVARRTVAAMCERMDFRGPDARGTLFRDEAGLGLGHVRLSIIDLADGDQPISNEDESVWVVFNGEIYNFGELRRDLVKKGHRFRTHSDTEVLVHLYEEKGADLVHHLLGDFAFVLWDQSTETLLAARDRLGVKPLYYSDYRGQLALASTLPALMAGADVPDELDPEALNSYLTFRTTLAPMSVYRHVRKLPPGHRLIVRQGRVRVESYWDLKMVPDHSRSPESFAEEVDGLIRDAVRRQMVSDVPLGAFLSGGLDSSTVVQCMTEASSQPVKTFSISFGEESYDESRFFRLLSSELGTEHQEMRFEPRLLEDVERIVGRFGEPCAIGSAIPIYYLARMAREHVTVVLTGDGADEIFAGYDLRYRYLSAISRGRSWLPRQVMGLLRSALAITSSVKTTSPLGNSLRRARKFFETASLPREEWLPYLTINRDLLARPESILNSEAPASTGPYASAFRAANGAQRMQRFVYADIKTLLPDEMFMKLDAMTMANSIEGRVPLCDHRLVELAARIPFELNFHGGRGKRVMRQAVESRLPQVILQRPKVGFRVPLDEWFRGELYPMARDLLTDATFRSSGLFDADVVSRLLQENHAGRQNFGSAIWALVAFELWRRSERRAEKELVA